MREKEIAQGSEPAQEFFNDPGLLGVAEVLLVDEPRSELLFCFVALKISKNPFQLPLPPGNSDRQNPQKIECELVSWRGLELTAPQRHRAASGYSWRPA
jgi:hypothetical protein